MYWWPFIVDGVEQTQIKPRQNSIHLDSILGRKNLLDQSPITGNGLSITPSSTVRLLEAYLDETMRFETHLSTIVRAWFFQLRQLKGICDYLGLDAAETFVNAFVVSYLDYCNRLLVGVLDKQLNRLQVIMNAAARLICRGRRYGHIMPLLHDKFNWLCSREWVTFKICVMVYKALHDMAPSYIKDLCVLITTNTRRSSLRFATDGQLVVPKTSTKAGDPAFAETPDPKHETNFQPMSGNHRH